MAWDVVETCPHCEAENLWENLDPVACGYKTICPECGKTMMLCDECMHANDNPLQKCDWRGEFGEEHGWGKCFRNSEEY